MKDVLEYSLRKLKYAHKRLEEGIKQAKDELDKLLLRNCKNNRPAENFTLDRKAGVVNYKGAGLPVVCFDGKNNRRFLEEGGIYASDDKVENLAGKIIGAVENPDESKRLGELNKKRVEEVFS